MKPGPLNGGANQRARTKLASLDRISSRYSCSTVCSTPPRLRDNAHGGAPNDFIDVFYFTVVSLTTVGYGDITPVTDEARLINAVLLTPIRVFLWALFLGTAYELTLLRLRFREERQMKDLRERLRNHVIICG